MWNVLPTNVKKEEDVDDEDAQLHEEPIQPLKPSSNMEEEQNEEEVKKLCP